MLFIVVLLLGAIMSIPLRYIFDVDIYVVPGVSLTLAMLWLLAALDGGWIGSTPGMMMLGLAVAVPVRLVFDTGFVSVLGISVVVGLVHPLLKGKIYREEARRRQREARLREPEQEQLAKEQEVRSYRPSRQDSDIERVVPTRPHELRAILYEEYLQSPHWKRRREDKLRAAGARCVTGAQAFSTFTTAPMNGSVRS